MNPFKNKLLVLVFLMQQTIGISKTYFTKGNTIEQKKYISCFNQNAMKDSKYYLKPVKCVDSVTKADTLKYKFINKISISVGIFNYWGLSNFEQQHISIGNSFHGSLISYKKKIAFRLGLIGDGESGNRNKKGNDSFRSRGISYVAILKYLPFKYINCSMGLAGSYTDILFYKNNYEKKCVGVGAIVDISLDITKRFYVNTYYINSLNLDHIFGIDHIISVLV